ncbi:MAG: glycosyltransferase [Alphaproteobacteria bacterium]|nr:glycosyltransferase [Alphaproteobacteria bacterium]
MTQEVILDVTRLFGRALRGWMPTGIDRVILAYIEKYGAHTRALVRFAGRWVVLDAEDSQRVFTALRKPGLKLPARIWLCLARGYAQSWAGNTASGTLLHVGHDGLDHPSYGREVRRRKLRAFFGLHDLIPITHPEYCRPGEAEKHRKRLETMVTAGRGLIISSAATKSALEDFAARQGWPLPPGAVAPLAPGSLPPPGEEPLLQGPYFVTLGTIEPRKNHLFLLHVWRRMVEELGDAAPKLVVIGQRGWECEQVIDMLDRCDALKGFVIEKPRCSDVELATYLRHARALLFPSFTEGFGLPLIEALMMGVPAIASDLPVFREFAGEIPEYLDPVDGLGWKRMILEYAPAASARYQAQCARIQGYAAPVWKNHFTVVDAFLKEMDKAA